MVNSDSASGNNQSAKERESKKREEERKRGRRNRAAFELEVEREGRERKREKAGETFKGIGTTPRRRLKKTEERDESAEVPFILCHFFGFFS